jgi:hypothetical protein
MSATSWLVLANSSVTALLFAPGSKVMTSFMRCATAPGMVPTTTTRGDAGEPDGKVIEQKALISEPEVSAVVSGLHMAPTGRLCSGGDLRASAGA